MIAHDKKMLKKSLRESRKINTLAHRARLDSRDRRIAAVHKKSMKWISKGSKDRMKDMNVRRLKLRGFKLDKQEYSDRLATRRATKTKRAAHSVDHLVQTLIKKTKN